MNVLIVCTGNTCRSPMAEGILKQLAKTDPDGLISGVQSAGTGTFGGRPATAEALAVCREAQIDITDHLSQPLSSELLDAADLVLTMEDHHRAVALTMNRESVGRIFNIVDYAGDAEHDGVADPIGGAIDEYRVTFTQIKALLEAALLRIRKSATGSEKG